MMEINNQGGGIRVTFREAGVLDSSIHHFAHPSAFALEHLFYVQSLGRFDVTRSYRVNRFNYSSYLMLVPVEGTLSCTLDGQTAAASRGSVLLLDCHRPHAYQALEPGSFYFLHFGGAMSAQLYRLINSQCGLKIVSREPDLFPRRIEALLEAREAGSEWREYDVSCAVYQLLLSLLQDATDSVAHGADQQIIAPIIDYIAGHLQEKLSVAGLASHFGYSAGYLTRLFRRYIGCAPYQFILRMRIDHGKHLLATTTLSVQEIADQTGFSNLANFCSAFRKCEGHTPGAFRKHPL